MRAILFDFGGTLDYPRHWLDRFLRHYRAAGVHIERPELDRAFTLATQRAYASSLMLREYSLSQLVGFLVKLQFQNLGYRATPSGSDSTRIQIRDWFVAESAAGLAKTRPLLSCLAQHFKIGVVSNFYGNLDRVVAEAGLLPSLAATADSGLLGFYKPDHRIFMTALTALDVQPGDAIMVGDSLSNDCTPARKVGMRTVWLRHHEFSGCAAPSDIVDFTISDLGELKYLKWLAG
jgi:FMN phosphatase YigB (HAD superfamily)